MERQEPATVRRSGMLGTWEVTPGLPHPSLRGHVTDYCGYAEWTMFSRRREAPSDVVPLIINLGPPLRMGSEAFELGFLAALSDSVGIVDPGGEQECLQVNFTPIGAGLFLGAPLGEVSLRVAALPEVLGASALPFVERVRAEPSWARRFRMVDGLIARRFAAARGVPADLAWAWRRLKASGGMVRVDALAAELGCSRKHLGVRFNRHIGLPPKTVGRILRFHGVVTDLARGGASLGEIAARHGYYDQAHLNRDFRALAGLTPTEHLARSRDGLGVIDDL